MLVYCMNCWWKDEEENVDGTACPSCGETASMCEGTQKDYENDKKINLKTKDLCEKK